MVARSYLRLRRTKIGLGDFKTVKVIGKGAFGEVSLVWWSNRVLSQKAEVTRTSIPRSSTRADHVVLRSLCLAGPVVPKDGYRQDLRYEDVDEE